MRNDTFEIKILDFEGPLDLLLQLIENRKMIINDVSLASVTDDYISYVKTIEHFPISRTAHFILIASTLLLLKSKSLLPTISITNEEGENIDDLEKKLQLYKYFQNLSKKIKEQFGKNIIFSKTHFPSTEPIFSPQEGYDITEANILINDVIKKLPRKKLMQEVAVKKVITLEKILENLTKRVQNDLNVSFNKFSNIGKSEKIHVIISFLAMLELVKQEIISVSQEGYCHDIQMESKSIDTPQY